MPVGELNAFGLHQYDNQTHFFSPDNPILSQGIGYAVVGGFGVFFAVITTLVMYFDKKYAGSEYNSEEFNTAGRAIKTGLTAVDVVSRSTWVATIVQSSNEAFNFGISGAFWYGAGVTAQFCVFGALALQLKRRAPKAHTVVELVRRRWGHAAGIVFLYICVLNNVVVCSLLIIGAANVLSAATGVNVYSALMLIPLSVIVYAVSGGLKAIFFSSYFHTIIICITLNIFCYSVYASDKDPIGSIGKVWENLNVMATKVPVPGNKDGSYMTMLSRLGFEFGMYNLLSSLGILYADQAFWQGVIAAGPRASFKGYLLGALLWFPIPFAMATAFGLSVRALDLPLSAAEANAGLVPIAAAQFVLGKGGVFLVLTMVFMAVTSVGSAEFLSISSLFTYDIYKAYINPKASGEQILLVSRIGLCSVGLIMGGVCSLLYHANVDFNFLFMLMGILVCSAAFPLMFMITWPRVPTGAAIAGALGGQGLGICTWLSVAQSKFGEMTISFSLQQLDPTVSGTAVCLFSSAIICSLWTFIAPGDPDSFRRFQDIELMDGVKMANMEEAKNDSHELQKFFKKTVFVTGGIAAIVCVIWPALSLAGGVFNKATFTFWVVLSLIWALITTLVCTFLPLFESRAVIWHVIKQILGISSVEVLPVGSHNASPRKDELKSYHNELPAY